jgi:hypothetical protein
MTAKLHDLVWAAALLDSCPDVEVIGVRVESDWLDVSGGSVPAVTLDVHAGSQADAVRLALALRLREVEGRVTESEFLGRSEWRAFRGWVADGSRDAAVLVQVTGADRVYAEAVA